MENEIRNENVENKGALVVSDVNELISGGSSETKLYTNINEFKTLFNLDNHVDYKINDCVGETIRVKIVEKDEDTCHLKLSIKDIDYRVNSKRRNKIIETEKGFETLSIKLEDWIEEKYSEIEKMQKTPKSLKKD